MKALIILTVLAFITLPAFAEDGHNAIDIFADSILGHNDSCPTVLQAEVLKEFKNLNLPLVGEARLQVGIGYKGSIRDLTEDNETSVIGRLIF